MFYEFIGRDKSIETGKTYYLTVRNTSPAQAGGLVAMMVNQKNELLWHAIYDDFTSFRLSWKSV